MPARSLWRSSIGSSSTLHRGKPSLVAGGDFRSSAREITGTPALSGRSTGSTPVPAAAAHVAPAAAAAPVAAAAGVGAAAPCFAGFFPGGVFGFPPGAGGAVWGAGSGGVWGEGSGVIAATGVGGGRGGK